MAKSAASNSNPVTQAVSQAVASGSIARSSCDALIRNYAEIYPDEMDALLEGIRNGSITVLERR